ncbi:hypothetical protein BHE74_00028496 [Ensete ventricosum]|nr:hypothetical protein GW17_00046866 [Ensete ventricosum]RWW64276.1 hypothetical protein BHE74_00028496 [Ensete ventricosum]RZS17260.1 hypothetical protein BHM03_00049382 [Ensete ventricosum]
MDQIPWPHTLGYVSSLGHVGSPSSTKPLEIAEDGVDILTHTSRSRLQTMTSSCKNKTDERRELIAGRSTRQLIIEKMEKGKDKSQCKRCDTMRSSPCKCHTSISSPMASGSSLCPSAHFPTEQRRPPVTGVPLPSLISLSLLTKGRRGPSHVFVHMSLSFPPGIHHQRLLKGHPSQSPAFVRLSLLPLTMNSTAFFVVLSLLLATSLCLEADPSHISNVTVMGTVFCDACATNVFSEHSYFLAGKRTPRLDHHRVVFLGLRL